MLDFFTNYSDFLFNSVEALLAALTILLSYIIFKFQASSPIRKERHEKLIVPIFFELEPFLYKHPDTHAFENVLSIIDKNKHLVDGKLLELTYYCKQNLSQENFTYLCSYIDFQYDLSCRRQHLKLRSITYRLNRKQYRTIFLFALYMSFFMIIHLAVAAIFLFLLYLFEIHSDEIVNTIIDNPKNLFICVILLFVAFYVVYNKVSKE